MNTTSQQKFTRAERRQIGTAIAALFLSGCGVIGLSRIALRVPFLRKRLQSEWRMRLACAGFMLSYNLLSRLQGDEEEVEEAPGSPDQPAD